jgi:hypothetical protein
MFDSRKKISGRLADAADLTIDFATLGEYGLEPVEPPTPACQARRRGGSLRMRSTGSWSSAIDRFAVHP